MSGEDRTEKPTAKRRSEARKKGQVAKSPDFGSALVLGAGLLSLSWLGPATVQGAAEAMRAFFGDAAHPAEVSSAAGLNGLMHIVLSTMLKTVAPLAGVCVAVGILANVVQVGFRPRFGALKPEFSRINPASGAKNLLGKRAIFETGKSLGKVIAVGGVAAAALVPQLTHLGASIDTQPGALASLLGSSTVGLAQRAALAYLLIGVIDFVYQRRSFEKNLRMTKEEVKEEFKQQQVAPEVRGALRRRQMQAARARMMAAVPQADVVVTNPTHFAVALSYDGSHPAPVVVAKGQDLVAAQIRRIARENDVTIVPDPPLARELHRTVEIGQMIPAELYAAVAQVLAFVYRMAGRRKVSA